MHKQDVLFAEPGHATLSISRNILILIKYNKQGIQQKIQLQRNALLHICLLLCIYHTFKKPSNGGYSGSIVLCTPQVPSSSLCSAATFTGFFVVFFSPSKQQSLQYATNRPTTYAYPAFQIH
jgi:hypothetical protein